MKKEYDYTMTEADLKKRPVWPIGMIRVGVEENGDPNKLDVFKIYQKDKKETTYAEYEKLLRLAEKDRHRMITDIRRYIYQLFERVQNGNFAFKYTLNDFRTGFEVSSIRTVARRLADVQNDYRLTERCQYEWDAAVMKIWNRDYHIGGKKYTEETLFIDVPKDDEYGDYTEHYSIPLKFLRPKYDFENDPVYKENMARFKNEAAYDGLFRHNDVYGEDTILKILKAHPDVVKEIEKALGKEKTKAFHEITD